MNINYELLKTFYLAAKLENISKVADIMYKSQPAISKSIKLLEQQLNLKLFIRTKKGVLLTEEGKLIFEDVKKYIEISEQIEEKLLNINNLNYGTINIGISKTLTENYLLKYLQIFNEKFPNIKIKIHTDYSKLLLSKLHNGLVDFIICNLPYETTQDLEIIKLKKINDCFITGNKYKHLANKKISINELKKYPLVFPAHGSVLRYNIDKICNINNIILEPQIELASHTLVIEFAKINLGIGIATENFISDELKNKNLYKLNIKESLPNRYIGLIYLKKNSLSKISQEFIKLLKESD